MIRIAESETIAKTEFFPMVISERQEANGERGSRWLAELYL